MLGKDGGSESVECERCGDGRINVEIIHWDAEERVNANSSFEGGTVRNVETRGVESTLLLGGVCNSRRVELR